MGLFPGICTVTVVYTNLKYPLAYQAIFVVYLLLAFPRKSEGTTGVSSWSGVDRESLRGGFSLVFLMRKILRNGLSVMVYFKFVK